MIPQSHPTPLPDNSLNGHESIAREADIQPRTATISTEVRVRLVGHLERPFSPETPWGKKEVFGNHFSISFELKVGLGDAESSMLKAFFNAEGLH